MSRTRSSLKRVPHGKLIAKVTRTRVHHATRSFFWETCGDGHDAGPGRLETSWNGLKIGVHARIGRRSPLVSSECKKKNLLQVHLLNRSDTVTVYYLLRHRQDSNLRRHCLVDTLWYGFESALTHPQHAYSSYDKPHVSIGDACDATSGVILGRELLAWPWCCSSIQLQGWSIFSIQGPKMGPKICQNDPKN